MFLFSQESCKIHIFGVLPIFGNSGPINKAPRTQGLRNRFEPYMYIYIYIYIYVYMYICIYVYMYICIYVYISIYIYLHILHVCIYIYIYAHADRII